MKTLVFSMMLCTSVVAAQKLSEEGLKRAQQAEQLLKADKPRDAIAILEKLDKDMPGHAAVSLRIAQIYDAQNENGLALFYYRRYIELAGEKAREEVQARTHTLELDPVAVDKAGQHAKKVGQQTARVAVPTPVEKLGVAVMKDDGSLLPVQNEEELQQIAKVGTAALTPTPAATPENAELVPNTSPTAPPQEGVEEPAKPTAPTRTPFQFEMPKEAQSSSPDESMTISGSGQDVRINSAYDIDQPRSTKIEVTDSRSQPAPQPSPRMNDRVTRPEPVAPQPAVRDGRRVSTGFFRKQRSLDGKTRLVVENAVGNSLMILKVSPVAGGDPVDSILATGEKREIPLDAGTYKVAVDVKVNTYPETTVLDRQFEYSFDAGYTYSRTVTKETAQDIQ